MTDKTLEELFPIGTEFNYLGRTLRVRRHEAFTGLGPAVVCNYTCANGVIREIIIDDTDAREIKNRSQAIADRYNAANQLVFSLC
jgi:hypothetical protein